MTVAQTEVVDSIRIENETENILLDLLDDLEWTDEQAHLVLLKEKLRTYEAFTVSGEVYDCLESAGRTVSRTTPVVIHVVFRYEPPEDARDFLARARDALRTRTITLRHEVI